MKTTDQHRIDRLEDAVKQLTSAALLANAHFYALASVAVEMLTPDGDMEQAKKVMAEINARVEAALDEQKRRTAAAATTPQQPPNRPFPKPRIVH